eukprot:1603181-Amphidinium_carterae.2
MAKSCVGRVLSLYLLNAFMALAALLEPSGHLPLPVANAEMHQWPAAMCAELLAFEPCLCLAKSWPKSVSTFATLPKVSSSTILKLPLFCKGFTAAATAPLASVLHYIV